MLGTLHVMHLVWKHDAKPPNPVPCAKARAKAYTRPLSLPLCRKWTFSNFSLQNIQHLASCRTDCLKNRWKEFKRWIRLPTPISFPHLLPPHPQPTADAANARSALVPSDFIQLMNDLIVKPTNVDGKFLEVSWILCLVRSHLSYSDKVRIMSYHHFHQQESSVPNCNHHSPTSAKVPQPTRCPVHNKDAPSACLEVPHRQRWLVLPGFDGISGVDFWSNDFPLPKWCPRQRENRSTKVSSDDFSQYHLSTSMAQIFPAALQALRHMNIFRCVYMA